MIGRPHCDFANVIAPTAPTAVKADGGGYNSFAALHVTHDREEAMTMADRLVVMDQGRIAQVGAPEDVYHRPASPFVAAFMGADNTIALEIEEGASGLRVRGSPQYAPTEIQGPAPTGSVIAFFRDDAVRIESPDHHHVGEMIPGRRTEAASIIIC